jgi:hypothetical protein
MFNKDGFKSLNLDAAGDIFFARQLEFIQAKIYEYQYPALKSFQLIPINYDVPAGAEYITATQYQAVGRARIINSYADDLPESGVIGTQLTNPVVGIGSSYRYSHQEIRAAQMARVGLPLRLAEAARRANDQTVDNLAFFGNPAVGMTGLLNNPNVPAQSVPADGAGALPGGPTAWVNKTPDQILRDMNLIVNQIVVNSNEVEMPDTLLLPLAQYTLIASTPRSANSDTTILNYFLLNNPYIRAVIPVPKLAGQGPDGVDIMVAYEKSENKLQMAIPLPFTQYSPQERNLEFVIPCESRFGGVSIYYPLSLIIGEGI